MVPSTPTFFRARRPSNRYCKSSSRLSKPLTTCATTTLLTTSSQEKSSWSTTPMFHLALTVTTISKLWWPMPGTSKETRQFKRQWASNNLVDKSKLHQTSLAVALKTRVATVVEKISQAAKDPKLLKHVQDRLTSLEEPLVSLLPSTITQLKKISIATVRQTSRMKKSSSRWEQDLVQEVLVVSKILEGLSG